MGSWGYGIRSDDFVCDVIGDFDDLLKAGKNLAEATKELKSRYSTEIKDPEEASQFWIAIAEAQWTYGNLDAKVYRRVQEDFESGRGLETWAEDERALVRRKEALKKFISKISEPNPRPKKPPKLIVRAPKFAPGDCLSVRLKSGQYAAALVLAADHSRLEYGQNLIVVLDYLAPDRPTLKDFRDRKWLVLSHHNWKHKIDVAWYGANGFRSTKGRIEIVGNIEILASDPKDSQQFALWNFLGDQVVYQREWVANLN